MSTEIDNFDEDLAEIGEGWEDLKRLYDSVREFDSYNEDESAATYESETEFVNAIQEMIPGEDIDEYILTENGCQLDAEGLNQFKHENLPVYVIHDPENKEAYIQFDASGDL